MRISDWSSDVCSSDLRARGIGVALQFGRQPRVLVDVRWVADADHVVGIALDHVLEFDRGSGRRRSRNGRGRRLAFRRPCLRRGRLELRSEEHTSELQSLMRISYAVFCLKKKTTTRPTNTTDTQ